jgi:hypothetical protein
MKYMFWIVITVLSLCAPFKAIRAQDFNPEWSACQQDSDCIVKEDCADIGINKKSENAFDEYTRKRGCDASAKHDPNATAKCINAECEVITPGMKK